MKNDTDDEDDKIFEAMFMLLFGPADLYEGVDLRSDLTAEERAHVERRAAEVKELILKKYPMGKERGAV